jgi:hypothetical protein
MGNEFHLAELNRLWEPIRPHLAKQVEELYGRRDGHILEIGPFAGLIFTLAATGIGRSFQIAAFPGEAADGYRRELGFEGRVATTTSDSSLANIAAESADLAIFRGALFFPSFFQTDFGAIYGILRRGGVAFVGGGFGKYTPPEIISAIGKRSQELNIAIGKVNVTPEDLQKRLRAAGLEERSEIVTEGGLWVVMRKV